ncbi:hypothetical protein RZS28_12585 [Methylocapsa polymorpha]|uniref:Flagellar assembly protein FliH/Type III secretion system HrpE domain-containing protein n=1 Tax=Methylocapsa polymorpha TaxID=3080828 RepID=A0ABZ0HNA4_9HYPH|nr:hypothetical protein RZS28_12585 [Methylocapsa sp. RX1]
MTARPVAQYLARFGSRNPPDAVTAPQEELTCLPLAVQAPAEDHLLLIQMAREEGVAEGLAAARAEHAAALAQEKLLFEGRLSADRERWTKDESERLAEKLLMAFAAIEASIAASVARVLRAFLIDLLRRKAVDELSDDVRALLGGREHPIVEISGPTDLLAALRERLSRFPDAIEYAANQSADVKVVADQTIIETRIEAWIERINALSE